MHAQKRDDNEAEILFVMWCLDYYVRQMDKTAGFDLLAVRKLTHIVEVKNPNTYWKLTEQEKAMKGAIEEAGGKYHVIRNVNEVLALEDDSLDTLTTQQLWKLSELAQFKSQESLALAQATIERLANVGMGYQK